MGNKNTNLQFAMKKVKASNKIQKKPLNGILKLLSITIQMLKKNYMNTIIEHKIHSLCLQNSLIRATLLRNFI